MQAILFAVVGMLMIAAVASSSVGGKARADRDRIAIQYLDPALSDAHKYVLDDLAAQVQSSQNPDGPFTDPQPSEPVYACSSADGACGLRRTVVVTYTGGVNSGEANTTAANANRAASVTEAPVYAIVTAQLANSAGAVVAQEAERLTLRVMRVPPYVRLTGWQTVSSKVTVDAERDTGGCDPADPYVSCGSPTGPAAQPGAAQNTMLSNYDRCKDDGDPTHGLCGPAGLRPDNAYAQQHAHTGNAVSSW